jgi:lysophospholipase L1-like esterase
VRALAVLSMLAVVGLLAFCGLWIAELLLERSFADSLYKEVRRRPPHPFLQVMPSGQVDHVNDQGFRGDPITLDKSANSLRIFTLGGSTTLGVSNPYQESYPYLLQQELRSRHPGVNIEVQNAGSAWYTTAHSLVNYELRVRRFRPDVIVFFEAINDLTRSFAPPWYSVRDFAPDYSHYLGPYARFAGPQTEFIDSSTWLAIHAAKRAVGEDPNPFNQRDPDNVARIAARLRPNDSPDFRSLPSYREFYQTLIDAVRADHHTLLLASQPFIYRADLSAEEHRLLFFAPLMCADHGTYPSLPAMINGMRLYNQAARELARTNHVPFLDFEANVPKTTGFFSDDVHLRRPANEILARMVADAVDAEGIVDAVVGRPRGDIRGVH